MSGTKNHWISKLADYDKASWSTAHTVFSLETKKYFPKTGRILELGAGLGQDSKWFESLGYDVVASDQVPLKLPGAITVKSVDLSRPLDFPNGSFDVVYSHLALHYFSLERTKQLFDEIYQVLKPGGILAFLVNSTADPEAEDGEKIESHYRLINGIAKRYFNTIEVADMTRKFTTLLLDNEGSSQKDDALNVKNLIRYVGSKTDK